jgi:hypothetical protein
MANLSLDFPFPYGLIQWLIDRDRCTPGWLIIDLSAVVTGKMFYKAAHPFVLAVLKIFPHVLDMVVVFSLNCIHIFDAMLDKCFKNGEA